MRPEEKQCRQGGNRMSIRFKSKGNFSATTKLLNDYKNHDYASILERYGLEGVRILAEATPKESGQTANSWRYKVSKKRGRYVPTPKS